MSILQIGNVPTKHGVALITIGRTEIIVQSMRPGSSVQQSWPISPGDWHSDITEAIADENAFDEASRYEMQWMLYHALCLLASGSAEAREVKTCESCHQAGITKAAVGHSKNPEWSGYELCAECITHYDAEPPVNSNASAQRVV